MNFRVGQPVICVDAEGAPTLKLNHVYTVREILPGPAIWRDRVQSGCGLLLQEAAPTFGQAFAAERFRAAFERKPDISIFKQMLTPSQIAKRLARV